VLPGALALTVFDAEHGGFEERRWTPGMPCRAGRLAVSHTCVATGPDTATLHKVARRFLHRLVEPRSPAHRFGGTTAAARPPAVTARAVRLTQPRSRR
jgi:hypothetical protein